MTLIAKIKLDLPHNMILSDECRDQNALGKSCLPFMEEFDFLGARPSIVRGTLLELSDQFFMNLN